MLNYYRNTTIVISGITLIALVVTIVVLLILAGITISLVFSENGIIAKAREAAEKTNQAVINEQAQMNELAGYMENMLNGIGGSGTTPEEPEKPIGGEYSDSEGVNTPQYYASQMTPIKWDSNTNDWVETTGSDPDWYDYSAKKWANARTSDGSMWVWIPRFAYSITSGYHSTTAGTIEVEFMKGLTNETSTGRTSFNNASGQGYWNIHPAFNYGQTVSGIWVAKFEASSVQGNSNSSGGDNVTTKTLQVKPGVASWRYIEIGNMYTVCLNYDSNTLGNANLNSHMMKNDEWGAVAYLSKSKYGKQNEEVTINSNSSYYTGGGSGNAYVTNVAQSTTGTVEGVYDMSGGSWEYVAAYVNNGNGNLNTYGSSLVSGETKTKNVYTMGSGDTRQANYNANAGVYGDAVYETSNGYDSSNQSWHDDYSNFPYSDWPFFGRGGDYNDGSNTGLFAFININGNYYSDRSFRPVLAAL